MNTKHTPGPWHVDFDCRITAHHAEIESVLPIALPLGDGTHDRRVADARLIAAAPDLLDALIAIADPTVMVDGRFGKIAIDRFRTIARAAIKKATGE